MSYQKEAFLKNEANSWFFRNKDYIDNYDSKTDHVISLIKKYNLKPNSVLEIGCSGGYRLNSLKESFPNSKFFGLDPSSEAKKYCNTNFPLINFKNGTADDLSHLGSETIDLLIVGFVFYVIDRNILFKVISEIDRVLKNNGELIILDFFSEIPTKNKYSHISEIEAFSYKQNYDEIFTSSKLYCKIDKSTSSLIDKKLNSTNKYFDNVSVSLLKKNYQSCYK